MPAGKFRLKSRGEILKLGKTPNAHQVSIRSGNSWVTISRYLADDEEKRDSVQSVDLAIMYGMLTSGLGLTDEQALDLKLRDIFEITKVAATE
jgi:hypothetical protein